MADTESVVAPPPTINASSGISLPAKSDSRKVWLSELRDNALSLEAYHLLIAYLEMARSRQLTNDAERAAEVHRRTLEKLAGR